MYSLQRNQDHFGTMNSPLSTFLRTNYALSDTELQQLKEMLVQHEAKLRAVNASYAKVVRSKRRTPKALIEKRKVLRQFVASYRALLSPIRRLPLEILQEIFQWCPPESSIRLTHVCSLWRSILLSSPLRWSTVHVNSVAENAFRHLVQLFSERSRGILLKFSVCLDEDESSRGLKVPHTPEGCRDLHVTGFSRAVMTLDVEAPSTLEGLSIDCSQFPASYYPAPFCPASHYPASYRHLIERRVWDRPEPTPACGLFEAVNLRSLCLRIPFGTLIFPRYSRPSWPYLTELTLDGLACAAKAYATLNVTIAVRILSGCPQLVRCTLWIASSMDKSALESQFSARNILLPHLKYLFTYDRVGESRHLFRLLQLPTLQEIEFHPEIQASQLERTPLLLLLKNWGQNLKKLTVDPSNFVKYDLWQCFRLIPSVTHLTITHDVLSSADHKEMCQTPRVIFDDIDIRKLIPSSTNPSVLCPNLKEFHCLHHDVTDDALSEFFEARCGSAVRGVEKLTIFSY